MHDVILLGATFLAAGIARSCPGSCLVIERRAQAGYEFFGALRYMEQEPSIYPHFQTCTMLFSTELVSVTKEADGFVCVTHGVEGFCTHRAKAVVDTRCSVEISQSKTYNLLIESKEVPVFENTGCAPLGKENRYLLTCPVPLCCGYSQARAIAKHILAQFSDSQRLILTANEFDYCVKPDLPTHKNGILLMPSKAYATPTLAFEAGSRFGKECHK